MEDKYIELYEYLQECVDNNVYTEDEANAILNIAYDRYITERSNHNKLNKESSDSDDLLDEIRCFNKELNSWDYGVLINGKVYTDSSKIDWGKYKTIPINLIKKYHVGVCWDFVNYEYKWFKDKHISTECYFFIMDKKEVITHTFLLFNYKGKKYWFESSWQCYQGIHEVKNEKDVIKYLINKYGKHSYDVYKYSPEGLDKNLTGEQFFDKASQNLIYSNKLNKKITNQFNNYIFLDVQSNKAKVLNYLKQSSETNKYAQDIVDNYSGEIIIFDGKMIGRIFIGNKKDKGFITDFSIDKEYRGNKLGSRLIDDAISKYGGYDLLVDKSNKLAINMYTKRGFIIYKTVKNQYWMILRNVK